MEQYIEQLIKKFWAGTASLEERQVLLRHLKDHDHRLWEEMESSFLEVDDPAVSMLMNESLQVDLLNKIHEKAGVGIPPKQSTGKRWSIAQLAVAASLLAVISVIAWLTLQTEERKVPVIKQAVHIPDSAVYNNNGAVAKRFTLPDRSVVVLEPGSRIYHRADFGNQTRMVNLVGAATFSVSHDDKRPFTVLANGYATTALGTEFLVNARSKRKTRIELFTGKVLVQALGQSRVKDVYLKPGDELTINNDKGKFFIVNRLPDHKPTVTAKEKPRQHTTVNNDPVLQFSQTPVEQVFARLSKAKKISIVTDEVDLKNKVFTGQFLPGESLETMVSLICDVNNLTYRIENSRIIIGGK